MTGGAAERVAAKRSATTYVVTGNSRRQKLVPRELIAAG
jgi:hypothetical protein